MNISDEQREKYFVAFTTIAVYTALYPLIFYFGTRWGDEKTPKGETVNVYGNCNDIGIFDMYGMKQISTITFFGLMAWGFKDKEVGKAWWFWILAVLLGMWMVYALIIYRFMPVPKSKQATL